MLLLLISMNGLAAPLVPLLRSPIDDSPHTAGACLLSQTPFQFPPVSRKPPMMEPCNGAFLEGSFQRWSLAMGLNCQMVSKSLAMCSRETLELERETLELETATCAAWLSPWR